MSEVRSLLDREARRMSASQGAMETMLRRGHQRARRTRVMTIVFALTLAAGSLAGVLAAFSGGRSVKPGAGGWAGIWPQTTLRDAEAAQSRADAGDPAYAWELDAKTVLRRFALEQLGWKGFTILEITDGNGSDAPGYNNESDLTNPDASGPFRFMTIGCDAPGPGVTCPSATVTIVRLLRPDRTGIWSVTKVEDQGTASGAYPTASPTASVMDGVREELMSGCFSEQEARELIASSLTSIGVTGWEIRTDGPLAYPTGEEDAVRNHIAAGCFVYSGSGRGPNGPTFYISGMDT